MTSSPRVIASSERRWVVKAPFPSLRHVFEAIENLVACVRLDLSQHHMDGVGSDIDDGNLCHTKIVCS